MYYYFFRNKEVVILAFEVISQDSRYERLTKKQVNFYKKHPDAKIHEIRNCKIDDPEPIIIDIDQLRADTIDEISKKSLGTMAGICSPYQFANAQASLIAIEAGEESIYDAETARRYISLYTHYGRICRNMFYEAKGLLEQCDTAEGIEAIKNDYFTRYDSIIDNDSSSGPDGE